MRDLLEKVSRKYKQILSEMDIETIKKVFGVLSDRRKNINSDSNISLSNQVEGLDNDTKSIFELMEKYKREIKQIFIKKDASITHITDVSPENMINGKIAKSINRPNNYETERGDWVFASSSPMDGNNPYIARSPKTGMIIIAKKAYIYGGDNMQIKKDEKGNNCVVLKVPNYVYEINPQNFMPVVTIKLDESEKPYFEFSEEWISDQDVDINDRNQVREIRKIYDITDVIKNYQVFCDVNMTGEARKIRSSSSMSDAIRLLKESIKNGNLRYINGESGINVSPKLDSSEVVTNILGNKENNENRASEERG